jgi:hypothetical protein
MNQNLLNISNEEYQWKYSSRTQSTLFASSIIGAIASATVMFSWENDGISDEEL